MVTVEFGVHGGMRYFDSVPFSLPASWLARVRGGSGKENDAVPRQAVIHGVARATRSLVDFTLMPRLWNIVESLAVKHGTPASALTCCVRPRAS